MSLQSFTGMLRRIELRLDTTLEAGSYSIPGVFGAPTRIRIPPGVKAAIRLHVEHRDQHLRIVNARLSLAPPIRFLNPRRGLHPSSNLSRNIVDDVKDFLADLLADGASLDPGTGDLEIVGAIDVLRLFRRPIPDEVHPRFNLDLDEWLVGSPPPAVTLPGDPAPAPPPELASEMLKVFASFIKPGSFHFELEADPFDFTEKLPYIVLGVEATPVLVTVEGRFEFDAEGRLRLEVVDTPPVLRTGLATASLSGKLEIGVDRRGSLLADASGRLRVEPLVKNFTVAKPPATHLPFTLTTSGGQIEMTISAFAKDGRWEAKLEGDGAVAAELGSQATFVTEGLTLRPSDAATSASAKLRVIASNDGVRVEVPEMSIMSPLFLPTGSLHPFKDALCAAARRGVAIRVLTSSERTAEVTGMTAAAVFSWRELLDAGCRIFVSKDRPIGARAVVFGDSTSVVGSWICDNRSETLTSEMMAVMYDRETAERLDTLFEADIQQGAAEEIRLDSIACQQLGVELRSGVLGAIGRLF